jgi:hypothetical protein
VKSSGGFQDTSPWAQVSVGELSRQGLRPSIAVVFRRRDDICHIVTAYPVKEVRDDIERKVKTVRWIPI